VVLRCCVDYVQSSLHIHPYIIAAAAAAMRTQYHCHREGIKCETTKTITLNKTSPNPNFNPITNPNPNLDVFCMLCVVIFALSHFTPGHWHRSSAPRLLCFSFIVNRFRSLARTAAPPKQTRRNHPVSPRIRYDMISEDGEHHNGRLLDCRTHGHWPVLWADNCNQIRHIIRSVDSYCRRRDTYESTPRLTRFTAVHKIYVCRRTDGRHTN